VRSLRQLTILTLLLAELVAGRPARADDTARAKAHFVKGEAHFSLGEFRSALVEYRRAYLLRPLPPLLFNMAQCHRHLGELERAAFLLWRFLESDPAERPREQARAVLELVEAARRKPATSPASQPTRPPASTAARSPLTRPAKPAPLAVQGLDSPRPASRRTPSLRSTPIYRRWWFWAAIGGLAAGAGAVAGAAVAATRGGDPPLGSLAPVDWR
jgi:tetratricopeptide (TPR) repeat protein